MHLRRALLLIAVILGLTALAASLAPSPRTPTQPQSTPTTAPPPTAAADAPQPPPTVDYVVPPPARLPAHRAVAGARVVVRVKATQAGEATIPSLGLTAPVEPGTPATFDLLVPRGSSEITFAPALGAPRPVGALIGTG